jgi:histone H3/H4
MSDIVENIQNIQNNEKQFSKNSIVNIARRAGIKCISADGIEKTRNVLNEKINELGEKLSYFYNSKNSKTVSKQLIIKFFESEGIHLMCNKEYKEYKEYKEE